MASVTKNSDENTARDEDEVDDDDVKTGSAPEKTAKAAKEAKGGPKEGKAIGYAKPPAPAPRRGFFTIYKRGQGYWTRMGTLIAVGVLGLLLSWTLYEKGPQLVPDPNTAPIQKQIEDAQSTEVTDPSKRMTPDEITAAKVKISRMTEERRVLAHRISLGVAIGFLVIYTAIGLRMMNKPANVDFLIATDSEMKKVNWTSRRELIGSTKVVVVFMLLIAVLLFALDWVFHLIFWLVDVLKLPPAGFPPKQ